jgi:hypothetical protein
MQTAVHKNFAALHKQDALAQTHVSCKRFATLQPLAHIAYARCKHHGGT